MNATQSQPAAPPLFAIFIVSAVALGYEILLMRLFSIVQWHHFAYMVISLALLGYGVSGTFLTLVYDRIRGWFHAAFVINAALLGISIIACFLLVQRVPFNTLEILWDQRQWWLLLFAYLISFIPFFFAANCVCLAFARFSDKIPLIYGFDLLGAGVGALGIILGLVFLHPVGLLRLLAVLALAAAMAAVLGVRRRRYYRSLVTLLLLAVGVVALPSSWLRLNISEYKDLSQALRVPDARIIAERSGPLGTIAVVDSPAIPLRYAPGMSLNSSFEPPPQLAVFSDGDFLDAITHYQGSDESLQYLDYLTSALPYHLTAPETTLILGLGGGSGVLQALYHDVARIDAVEINPHLIDLLRGEFRDYTGWDFLADRVEVYSSEARAYLAGNKKPYALIQLALLDAASAAGLQSLSENYLYTVEAFREYLQHLAPGGMLSFTRWVSVPPRDGLKLFATAVKALGDAAIDRPGERLVMIRGWKTNTLLVKNGAFTGAELDKLRQFCKQRSFDPVYYPGMPAEQANTHNLLAAPYYYQGALALLGEQAGEYRENYKFDIDPATDDRPYFYNFFKWSVLPELLSLYGRGGVSLLELGYPVLIATLIQALVVSLLLILAPLLLSDRKRMRQRVSYNWGVVGYFSSIGLAYLFIEIAFMQKFVLFLGHPLYAISVVLCGFLLFSGIGSYFSRSIGNRAPGKTVLITILILGLISVAYLGFLGMLFQAFIGSPEPVKIVLSLALIAPVAFCMGIPFPLGLGQVAVIAPHLVPWAWGVNGCASLISAILATLMAVHFGFSMVILSALALYLLAGMIKLS